MAGYRLGARPDIDRRAVAALVAARRSRASMNNPVRDAALLGQIDAKATAAVGGQTFGVVASVPTFSFTLPRAMAAGDEDQAIVWWGGQRQDPSQYTFDGTATATMAFSMAVGDAWAVYVAPVE